MQGPPLAYDTAKYVYNVLVLYAGATDTESARRQFYAVTRDGVDEYRFQGLLGYTGKLVFESARWWVTCDKETPSRLLIIEKTNRELADVKAWFESLECPARCNSCGYAGKVSDFFRRSHRVQPCCPQCRTKEMDTSVTLKNDLASRGD